MARLAVPDGRDAESIMRPGEKDATLRNRVSAKLSENPQYEGYLRLLSDDDLWSLMQIPFSPELAELTQQIGPRSEPDIAGHTRTFYEEAVALTGSSKDQMIIREAIARALEKSPSELTSANYETVTQLDLSHLPIEDLTELKHLKNLDKLRLDECKKLEDIEPLKALTKLEVLSLSNTPVADTQVERLQKALPNLKIIR